MSNLASLKKKQVVFKRYVVSNFQNYTEVPVSNYLIAVRDYCFDGSL